MLRSRAPAVRLWLLDLPDAAARPPWALPCRSPLGSRGPPRVLLPLLDLRPPPPPPPAVCLRATGPDDTSLPSLHSPSRTDPSSCVRAPSPSGTKLSSTRPVYRPVRPVARSVCIIFRTYMVFRPCSLADGTGPPWNDDGRGGCCCWPTWPRRPAGGRDLDPSASLDESLDGSVRLAVSTSLPADVRTRDLLPPAPGVTEDDLLGGGGCCCDGGSDDWFDAREF